MTKLEQDVIDEAHRVLEVTWTTIELRLPENRNTPQILNKYVNSFADKLGVPLFEAIKNEQIPGMYHLVYQRKDVQAEVHEHA
ncbi:MAG: hypothetical protein WD876_03585 [Candidatus Pacearchaeota archaeon]